MAIEVGIGDSVVILIQSLASGREAIREYWTRQWSGINPNVEPVWFSHDDLGRIVVDVHQVVRDLDGNVIDDRHVGHRYTFSKGLIQRMEICPL
jgi:hypothetical protein